MKTIERNNLRLWSSTAPKAAIYVPMIDCGHLRFCKSANGQLNLKSGKELYHSSQNPQKEAEEWFSTLDLSNASVLCVYGVGLGYAYEAAKDWLKKDKKRFLIFLEDDLAVIRRLFEMENGAKILKDSQVQLHFFSDSDLEDPFSPLAELYWSFLTSKIVVDALPFYKKTKQSFFLELQHKVVYDATTKEGFLQEYLEYGVSFFKNFYPNMLSLPGAHLGNCLFNKFRNVPAIICGAGPSLEKNLPLLSTLQNNALIFAGGSSLNALNAAGIQPHFGAGIDPNLGQFDRLKNSPASIPFLYRNRFFHPALALIQGPRLYVTGSGGYDVAAWFEEKLKIKGTHVDEGLNVVNFCCDIALAFGCNPIIFVGMDLAYTGMRSYAPGVIKKRNVTKREILEVPNVADQALLKKDIYGKPIYTLWKWIAEAHWIESFAKEHPKATLINATEGGLGIPNVPNMPLKEVQKKYLLKSYDLYKRVQKEIQKSELTHVTQKKVVIAMKELMSSLQRCVEGIKILLEETHLMEVQIKREKREPMTLQSGKAILYETELAEEPGYRYVLDIFNRVYTKILSRDLQVKRPKKMPEWHLSLKRLELNSKKLVFLHDVALVNIELIKQTLTH